MVTLAPAADVPTWLVYLTLALAVLHLVLVYFESRASPRPAALWVLGGAATLALLLSVLRPEHVTARERTLGAKVWVLVDTSRSMQLPAESGRTRAEVARTALLDLRRVPTIRPSFFEFGEGAAKPLIPEQEKFVQRTSDFATALRSLRATSEEPPASVVVVSDGRFSDLGTDALDSLLAETKLGVPVSTLLPSERIARDASITAARFSGSAIAHAPVPLRVEVSCWNLAPSQLPLVVREIRKDGTHHLLATASVPLHEGHGAVDLTVTLDRAGAQMVSIAIEPPEGDEVAENNRRFLPIMVRRERVRILHVAGRPTQDVRALREWLKGDASVDTVAFFILRTPGDTPMADKEDLALIPFPVDELFTEHLASFDAVVLQDFDAQPYGLEKHLPALTRYVLSGGGLVMVGGPNSFVSGGYAGTPLSTVLPVELDKRPGTEAADVAFFTPAWTAEGEVAPMLHPLRSVTGGEIPSMPGTNVLGDPRPGSLVLWVHPTRKTASGARMPVLAIGDFGGGRSVAFSVDGSYRLRFSDEAEKQGGRGHAALWDGLLGWLMRDPRYEPAQLSLPDGCGEGKPLVASLVRELATPPALSIRRVDTKAAPLAVQASSPNKNPLTFALPPLEDGAYTAELSLPGGVRAETLFACERGGNEWADPRPNPDLLAALAKRTGGRALLADRASDLPIPKATRITEEKRTAPMAPPWVFTLVATSAVGAYWIVRRKKGLA